MWIKTINHKTVGKVDYKIYSKEEADAAGIKYVDWWKAEPGEYGKSYDDIVCKLITKTPYAGHGTETTTYYVFPVGSIFRSNKYPTKRLKLKNTRGTYSITNKDWMKRFADSPLFRQVAMYYAQIPIPDVAIDKALGNHSEHTHRKWRRLIRTEEFRTMVREEINKLLRDKGFSEAETLDLLQETIELCKGKRDTATLMRAIENLLDMHGMKQKDKVKTTESIEGSQTTKLIDDVNREEHNYLKLTREIEENDRSRELITEEERSS